MPIDPNYTYKARPVQDIIKDLIDLKSIPDYISKFDMKTGRECDLSEITYQKYKDQIEEAVRNESSRVIANLLNIPLNHTVELDANTHIQRVPFGVIYIYRTFSNQGAASSVIHKSTQFVKL